MSEPINIPKIVRRCRRVTSSPESFPYSARHLNIELDTVPENFKTILPIITEFEIQKLVNTGWLRIHCGTSQDAFYYCKRLTDIRVRSWVD